MGGGYPEQFRQGVAGAIKGDSLLFHGFQQGSLGFGAGVRLISSASSTWVKDRAFFEGKAAAVKVKDVGTRNVGRKNIWGQLNARKIGLNQPGQGSDQQGFAGTGHPPQE